ncbi:MAG: hypothetical protein AMJ90_08625 [candidate division Zixibacteria bacterium SM23_73_2]|nr:MAG: hypothetical protein AMJ90_08625 [candidate division Zixibacteria bacterium SM23_73_2]
MKKPVFLSVILFLLIFNLSFPQSTDQYLNDLKMAEALMNQGMYQQAITMLERWYESSPQDQYLVSLLRRGYNETKSYLKLKDLYLEQTQINPKDWMAWCIVGDAQIKLDQLNSADSSFQKAIEVAKDLPEVYRIIANFYLLNGITYKAIEIYFEGNSNLKSKIFSRDIAHLYEALRDYGSAVKMYFEFMGKDTTRYNAVESQILSLIDEGEDLEGIELALKDVMEKKTLDKWVYPLYGAVFLKRGELEPAFQIYKNIDHLWEGRGNYILFFAKKCFQEKAYDLTITICDYILSSYPQSPLLAQALLVKAKSKKQKEDYPGAISEYQKIIGTYKNSPEASEAIFQIGEIEFDYLKKTAEAKKWYTEILNHPESGRFGDAMIRIGDCFLVEGKLDSSYLWYGRVQEEKGAKDRWEEAKFKSAEIDFYRGKFDQAEKGYNTVVSEYPKGFLVNNSLERLVLLRENMGSDATFLLILTEALLEKAKRNYDKAKELFIRIINFENEKLSDLCLLEIALIQKEKGEFENSVSTLERLQENYPESPYSALAQKMIGDLFYYHLKDKIQAEKSYQLLLEKYSNSMFVEEARENLKELKDINSP